MQQDNQYLMDILHAAQRIEGYTAQTTLANFYEDIRQQDKVIRRLLSISKSAKRISAAMRQETDNATWNIINKINTQLMEDDPYVDIDQLWNVARYEMPGLVRALNVQLSAQRQDRFSFASAF